MPHVVVILALAPAIGYDLAIPPVIFGAADDENGVAHYDVRVCGLDRSPIVTTSGYAVVPGAGPEALGEADTVIVPGTRIGGPRTDGTVPGRLAEALATIRPGTRLMSICTGAFVLAAAGFLDGRRATTHWAYADAFRTLYPQVDLDEQALFVDAGNVLTSAGLAAGVDLCLHVLRRDVGSATANQVARYCVVPPWRAGGQAQFIDRPVPVSGDDGTAPTRAWALSRLHADLDLPRMAAHARMSVRTFSRRFKAETGLTPGGWLRQERMRHARQLLETTDLPVDRVADAAGLGSPAALRHHMRAELGVAPLAYRRTFRTG
ncbi:GlxA family transcriptional regulator [Skermania piniformis]|uniref:Helix-turn-helix domain-containing protein n=1 Tax=Skermania pinensis TaxID=39122 RepID=A0ABX8SBE4_9ACTN|nr:helix-turn-helix domain-containing protein [Skermania piniformis]QXQ15190.1 helix-turn-helix domain-containing protein [Skermania piniformis]